MPEKAPQQDLVTFIDLPDGVGSPIVGRASADEHRVQGAIALVPTTDEEHLLVVDRLGELNRRYGDITRGNAEPRLGQAAAAAYAILEAGGTQGEIAL